MQSETAKAEQQNKVCPICNAEITFKEKDGDVEFWDCPNCGKINLKKEQWKKLVLTPTSLPEVHVNCNFCKNKHSEKCPNSPNPDTCSMYEENQQISNSDKIVMLIDQATPTFLKDQNGNFHVQIRDNKVLKTLDVHSEEFKQICRDRFIRTFGKVPRSDNVKDVIKAFEAIARNAQVQTLKPRVNLIKNDKGETEIWIDTGNRFFQSIKITKNSHTIQDETPPLFKRYKHMKALPLPKNCDGYDSSDVNFSHLLPLPPTVQGESGKNRGGGYKNRNELSQSSQPSQNYVFLKSLNYFMNLGSKDFFLTLCHMVNAFFIDRPQTTLSVNGKKGSGKTYVSEIIKKVLDPSVTLTLDMPKTRDELLHNLDHHFYPCFDNVSYLSHEFSDIFCRANTGAGTFKRMLWTDDEEFIRAFLKSININGINVVVVREDLLDRTILVFVLSFNGNRKTEAELEAEFNKILPFVLHDLYNLVSEVMVKLPETEAPSQFRMMDFAKIGCAVAEALGYGREYFIEVYTKKLNEQIKEAIYNHTFGNVLLAFAEDKDNLTFDNELKKWVWRGTPTELYSKTKTYAKDVLLVSTGRKAYPSASNTMSRQINDLTDAFSKIGIKISYNRDSAQREWTIINNNLEPEKTELKKLEALRNWIKSEKGMFDTAELKSKIAELGFVDDPEKIIQRLIDAGDIGAFNYIEKLGGSQD